MTEERTITVTWDEVETVCTRFSEVFTIPADLDDETLSGDVQEVMDLVIDQATFTDGCVRDSETTYRAIVRAELVDGTVLHDQYATEGS